MEMTDEKYEKVKQYLQTTLGLELSDSKEEQNRKRNIYNDDNDDCNVCAKTRKLNSGDKVESKKEEEEEEEEEGEVIPVPVHVEEKIHFLTSALERTKEDITKYSNKIKKYEEAGVTISNHTQTIEEFYSSKFNQKRNRLKYAKKRLKEAQTSNQLYMESVAKLKQKK